MVALAFEFLATIAAGHPFVSVCDGDREAILCLESALAGTDCEWNHRIQIDDDGHIGCVTDMVRRPAALTPRDAAADRT